MLASARRDAARLFSMAGATDDSAIGEDALSRLPRAVAAYLRLAGVPGRRRVRSVRLRQRGKMRLGPDKPWLPLCAEQYHLADPPGFVWYGEIKPMPLVRVAAKDMFLDGRGRMLVKLAGLIPLADATGPETDQGELLRYLGEIVWFPTAWLSPGIVWEDLGGRAARATISHNEVSAGAVFEFNRRGLPARFTAMRHREVRGRFELTPWAGTVMRWGERNGFLVPLEVMATWRLVSGDFHYIRLAVESIEHDRPEPYGTG